jgi:hypothetical protein
MPEFISKFDDDRHKIWPEIQNFLNGLPPSLQATSVQFQERFAAEVSSTGEIADAFANPATARVVYLPFWFMEAYESQGISFPDPGALKSNLFASALLGSFSIRINDDLLDEDDAQSSREELLLATLCTRRALWLLQELFPHTSPFWTYHHKYWAEYTGAMAHERGRNVSGLIPFDNRELLLVGHKAALLKSYPVAVALLAGKNEQVESIERLMDAWNIASQLRNDIRGLRNDLESRNYTFTIAMAALACDEIAGTHPPVENLYGALALSDGLKQTFDTSLEYYGKAVNLSKELGIDNLSRCLEWHIDEIRKAGVYCDAEGSSAENTDVTTPIAHPQARSRSECLESGLAFLQEDPLYRESWEIQRTGLWDQKELIGDLFCRSVIVETLAELGVDVQDQVGDLLGAFEQNCWRHYRDFPALPPDIDNIAQGIRLLQHSDLTEEARTEYLKRPLRLLESNWSQVTGFPVWLTNEIDDMPAEGWVGLGGNSCVACEANLLSALASVESVQLWNMNAIVTGFLDRWETRDTSTAFYYTRDVRTMLVSRCLRDLSSRPSLSEGLASRIKSIHHKLIENVESASLNQTVWPDSLACAVALLTLLDNKNPSLELIEMGLDFLRDNQAYDGGWEQCDFYRCPGSGGGGLGWHGSRLLTSGLVVRASRICQTHLGGLQD